ncbi:MAG: RNA polymerase-binding protein DksA [Alphaproteobacteria bacterium]|jgi:DnaK suppressor protein|nr:RNA polymerase-binding protein DksA [Alphaproteobacteria bacterium]
MNKNSINLPKTYKPAATEKFMGSLQREYFRQKILQWRQEIITGAAETLSSLKEHTTREADINDQASIETDRSLELRARDRDRKLLSKIDAALERIKNGTYGYCEETGEPISLARLEARPIATLSIEAQERHERKERVFREE